MILFVPNPNYLAGRAYEYKAKHDLQEKGYTVIRSAGSHGPWDLIAFKAGEIPRCIQIKRVHRPGAVKRVIFDFDQTPREAGSTYREEIWVYFDRQVIKHVHQNKLQKELDTPA